MSTEYYKHIYHPKYEPAFKNEFLDIIDNIEEQVRAYNLPTSKQEETKVLCSLFLYSILSMIRAIYILLEERRKVEVDILKRSLIEYYLDLSYLALNNNYTFNRRFIKYYVLIQYWSIDKMTSENAKLAAPRFTADYKHYVENEFSEITQSLNRSDENYLKQLDKKIADKYKKSWSGLNSAQRLEAVQRLTKDDPIRDIIVRSFYFYSNKTHPTPYGIPIFDASNGIFLLERFVADSALKNDELFLFWVADGAIRSFSKTLPVDKGKTLLKRFYALTEISTSLRSSLEEQGENN